MTVVKPDSNRSHDRGRRQLKPAHHRASNRPGAWDTRCTKKQKKEHVGDLWIAATAIRWELPLVGHDVVSPG
jgi:predicted nucleic acid-binding protein